MRSQKFRNAYKLAHARRKRAERRHSGICLMCGQVKVEPPYSKCKLCRKRRWNWKKAKEPERRKKRAEKRKEEGVCIRCGKRPAATGKASCPDCLKEVRDKVRARYWAKKMAKKKEEEAIKE